MRGPVDPALIVELISVVIRLLMQLLASDPRKVSDYLTGRDVGGWRRPCVMWRRNARLRRIIRGHLKGPPSHMDAAENEVMTRLSDMQPGTVLAWWCESQIGREG